jgi:3-hydroxyisobutyrate dehydrogenase-like beta-hydroxyacid dehydrogenase
LSTAKRSIETKGLGNLKYFEIMRLPRRSAPRNDTSNEDEFMSPETIGILHPGAMGVSIAASALRSGHRVCYASEGRSQATRARAAEHDLHDMETLAELCKTCSIIISVCPPHAAEDVARQVIDQGFKDFYLDANAISPQKAQHIGEILSSAGITFVDGGIIGGPAWTPGETWLYLSGKEADRIAGCFAAGPLEVSVIGEAIGKASALKMCYAAYTKGTTALLAAILALAEASGVRYELETQWERDESGFSEQAERRVRRVTARAWRFAGEMDEIASTFKSAGLPDGFHIAAGDVYRQLAHFKGAEEFPDLRAVLDALLTR